MLGDMLRELKQAINAGDTETEARIRRQLYSLGMDAFTIRQLLMELE